jgi:hypothetical protein
VDRLKDVPLRLGTSIVSAVPSFSRVKIKLSDGGEQTIDHILLATGYRVDITKYDFLAPRLVERIQQHNGFPVLQPGLETSVAGLHMVGAPAVWSFGPLMQFVSGTTYASAALTRALAGSGRAEPVRNNFTRAAAQNSSADLRL